MREVDADFLEDFSGRIIDVRSPAEFEENHIRLEDAVTENYPLRSTDFRALADRISGPVVVVCWKGVSSRRVVDILGSRDVDAYSLAGGMESWKN